MRVRAPSSPLEIGQACNLSWHCGTICHLITANFPGEHSPGPLVLSLKQPYSKIRRTTSRKLTERTQQAHGPFLTQLENSRPRVDKPYRLALNSAASPLGNPGPQVRPRIEPFCARFCVLPGCRSASSACFEAVWLVALIFDNLVDWVDGIFVHTKRSCPDRPSGKLGQERVVWHSFLDSASCCGSRPRPSGRGMSPQR